MPRRSLLTSPARLLGVIAVLALLALVPSGAAQAARYAGGASPGEQITRYDVRMTLRDDSSMLVEERIDYDFGRPTTEKHGIYRYIPNRYYHDETLDRVYPLDDLKVSSPTGAPDDVDEESRGGEVVIRIGHPDKTVEGRHTYVIRYVLRGVVNPFPDHQELYWNAIGTGWSIPISNVTVTVSGPAPVQEVACYQGQQGSTLTCPGTVADGTATFRAPRLETAEGLTVVTAFPAGAFRNAGPILEERQTFARAFTLNPATVGGGLGLFALLGGGALFLAGRRGRDEHYLGVTPGLEPGYGQQGMISRVPLVGRPPIAVQFNPPPGMRPGQLGTLIDERAHTVDVTATIIDLAVRGYLRVEEIQKKKLFRSGDWRLVQVRKPDGDLHEYEETLLRALFKGRKEVLLSDLKQTFRSDLQKVQKLLYEDVTKAGWFRGNPSTVRTIWVVLGVLAVAAGLALTVVLAAATKFGVVGLGVLLGGVVLLIVAPRMPARTPKGTAMLAQAQGFRMYLETAEADQIRFEEGEDIFSRYLPYAIVFGVADRWARVFAQLAASGAAVAAPTWYVGSGYGYGSGLGSFDYDGFGSTLDDFTTSTSGAIAAATPSSSGSSGFGGGFSGGGGGGGGGGSW